MDDTLASEGTGPQALGTASLLVLGAGRVSTHALAAGASLVIGRDSAADIALEHPKVSRRHAIVHANGSHAVVEDGRGTNRVRLNGRTLDSGERAALPAGESFQVGPFTIVLLGLPSPTGESVEGRAALVVRDASAEAMTDLVARIAASDVSVVIAGETGAGKEVLARSLHHRSGRTGEFVAINCASLTEPLLESELFGHEKGAFTGAVQAKPGLFEMAAGGTIFLDEIADLPPSMQPKLLRAIETRQVLRVGGLRPIELDVRFLAATHRDLRTEVADARFRQDLYYRLSGVTLTLVPLRERKQSIGGLAQEFVAAAAARAKRAPPQITPAALAVLVRHPWPGNVRELKATIERAMLMSSGDIDARHVVVEDALSPAPAVARPEVASRPAAEDDTERARIMTALASCAGNQTRAATLLKMSRATLAHKIALHRIPRPRK